jgi:uncharacterized protein YkwD
MDTFVRKHRFFEMIELPKSARRQLFAALVLVSCFIFLPGCSSARTYTVQAGDTLQGIAFRNSTTVSEIVDLNKDRYPSLIKSPGSIHPGWQLKIPSDSTVALDFDSLLMQIARTASPPKSSDPPVAAAANDKIDLIVQRIFDGIKQERAQKNLRSLGMDLNLENIAQARSNDMIARSYFSHNDPKTGQVLFQQLLNERNFFYMFAGENIAEIRNEGAFVPAGFTVYARYSADDLASQFVNGWINSPEHYANIVNPHFHKTGIAIGVTLDGTRVVATQVFTD